MTIVYDEKFVLKLGKIWHFIAMDSQNRANVFRDELRQHIESIPDFPYKFRKSKWFNDERVRDMIFKGYTIPYYVQDDKIVILDIFKWDK